MKFKISITSKILESAICFMVTYELKFARVKIHFRYISALFSFFKNDFPSLFDLSFIHKEEQQVSFYPNVLLTVSFF